MSVVLEELLAVIDQHGMDAEGRAVGAGGISIEGITHKIVLPKLLPFDSQELIPGQSTNNENSLKLSLFMLI